MTRSLAGIYKITNNLTGKCYVGQSKNVFEREIEHFTALRRKRHPNKDMQRDWNKSNRGFRFNVIEFCAIDKLNEREKYWIEALGTLKPHGYNADWVPYKRKEAKPKKRKVKGYHRSR